MLSVISAIKIARSIATLCYSVIIELHQIVRTILFYVLECLFNVTSACIAACSLARSVIYAEIRYFPFSFRVRVG